MNLHILTPYRAKPTTLLPRCHYLVDQNLIDALNRSNVFPDVQFPDQAGPWVILPEFTTLVVYEDDQGQRLCCKHVREDRSGLEMSTIAFDRDQALLDKYLDA